MGLSVSSNLRRELAIGCRFVTDYVNVIFM